MTKTCSKCGIEKPFDCFNVRNRYIDGRRPDCKDCRKIESKAYREKNKDRIREQQRFFSHKNKESKKEYHKKWYLLNKEYFYEKHKEYVELNRALVNERRRLYISKKEKTDHVFKLKRRLRTRIKNAIRNKFGFSIKTEICLGADIVTVRNHIESMFKDGMSWDNYGSWHIDHIVPLSIAKSEEDLVALCFYKNLQPMWAKENILKGNSIPNGIDIKEYIHNLRITNGKVTR